MRKIKFRAWDKLDKQMFAVKSLHIDNLVVRSDSLTFYSLDDVELMQYTGLKDKNGVEIYEGDVLFHPLQGRRKVFYPYSETVASYGLRNIDNGFGSTLQDSHAVFEVIGNIYENEELLNER